MTLDLTCRACDGDGRVWDQTRNDWYHVLDFTCPTCDGAGHLDVRQVALDVARAHGTRIAAEYSGLSDDVVPGIRRDHDGYDRGRGRPSRAEMAAMAPRLDCSCLRCLDHRTGTVRAANQALGQLFRKVNNALGDWRDDAACADPAIDIDIFFPGRGETLAPALAVCSGCPVRTSCAEAGWSEHHGIWGGMSERERRRRRRGQHPESEVA